MLTNLTIKNFRSLKEVSVKLKPLTILVGANDSGKSAFLSAISILAGREHIATPRDQWRFSPVQIEIHGKTSKGSIIVGTGHSDVERRNLLQPVELFVLPSSGIATESAGVPDQAGPPVLASTGENVAALLDYLYRIELDRFFAIRDAARSLIPGLENIVVKQPSVERRRIELVIEGGMSLQGQFASAGLKLLLFFLALSYHPTPPRVILLEEPENGVHPKRLGDVVRLLREITDGKHGGHAAQVILTTHSPYLLDHVDLSKDQVLVFRRNDNGSRTAEAADSERLKTFLDEYMLGEVWYNVGEEGLVSRKPA